MVSAAAGANLMNRAVGCYSPPIDSQLRLPPKTTSAGAARRFVTAALIREGHADTAELAALLVNELVTNAILHAGTEFGVRLRRAHGRIRVEVADGGDGTVALREYGAEASTGRGLLLVEELAHAWGIDSSDHGKVVWFEIDASEARMMAESGT